MKRHVSNLSYHVVSYGYLINGLQGHAVYGLVSNGSFLLRFYNDEFAVLGKVFQHFLNRKLEDPFEIASSDLANVIYFDIVVSRMSDYASKTNF